MKLLLPLVEVDKVDYFGVPYKTKILGHPKRNYGTMWTNFVQMSERNNIEKEQTGVYQGGHQPIGKSFVEQGINKEIEQSFG